MLLKSPLCQRKVRGCCQNHGGFHHCTQQETCRTNVCCTNVQALPLDLTFTFALILIVTPIPVVTLTLIIAVTLILALIAARGAGSISRKRAAEAVLMACMTTSAIEYGALPQRFKILDIDALRAGVDGYNTKLQNNLRITGPA